MYTIGSVQQHAETDHLLAHTTITSNRSGSKCSRIGVRVVFVFSMGNAIMAYSHRVLPSISASSPLYRTWSATRAYSLAIPGSLTFSTFGTSPFKLLTGGSHRSPVLGFHKSPVLETQKATRRRLRNCNKSSVIIKPPQTRLHRTQILLESNIYQRSDILRKIIQS